MADTLKTEASILRHHGITATFEGEGDDRALNEPVPRDVARAAVDDLEAAGYEASWAPDNDDRSMAWIYVRTREQQAVREAAATLGRKGGQAGKGSPARRRAAIKAANARWYSGNPQTVRVTSKLFSADFDTPVERIFWVPSGGGYVRDVSEQPGTLGPQVCEYLDSRGNTLTATPETLGRIVRRELAKRRAWLKREMARR